MQTSGSHVNNLTAAFAALPCPDLPEAHAAAQAADARAAARNGSAAAAAAAPFTEAVLTWTPGIAAGACMAGGSSIERCRTSIHAGEVASSVANTPCM
jgi:hypothetical protein